LAFDGGDGRQLWQRWAIETAFNESSMVAVAVVFNGGSSVRRRSMVSAMDYDKRTRGWRKEKQRNNQPAR
jgi:hypothetical protein